MGAARQRHALVGPNGRVDAVGIPDSYSDAYLLPLKPLDYSTRYTATASFRNSAAGGSTLTRSFSFTTEAAPFALGKIVLRRTANGSLTIRRSGGNRPLQATLDLQNDAGRQWMRPITLTVNNGSWSYRLRSLFPKLPPGHYLCTLLQKYVMVPPVYVTVR